MSISGLHRYCATCGEMRIHVAGCCADCGSEHQPPRCRLQGHQLRAIKQTTGASRRGGLASSRNRRRVSA